MVIWAKPARTNLREIHDVITLDSPYQAKKVVQEIREKADTLNFLPKQGKRVYEVKDENIREVPIYSYRIIYEIKEKTIVILLVAHKRQDLKAKDINLVK